MQIFKSIDAKKAKEWLDKDEAVIVDVREPAEYASMHIPGATLIPLGVIEESKLPKHANKKLIIHCQLGKRGTKACEKLLQNNPNLDIYNLDGGIVAWEKAGFTVEKTG